MMRPINPAELGAPKGYSNGMVAPAGGRLLFVAGQIGWDAGQKLASSELAGQFQQALRNVLSVVREAGGQPEHLGRLTIYVTDKGEYLRDVRAIGAGYRELMGKHFPAMALVEVAALLEPGAKVEIEATAVLP
jgi:enamine deaminase RidA (YjgF/YER057c/UK114 family)